MIVKEIYNKENDSMYRIYKNNLGLYDVEYLEYSKICNTWNKISKDNNYSKDVIESIFYIKL
jgi:hypothetical protein